MYAIVEIAGHQFKVEKDQKVFVNRLPGEEGDQVSFENVLLADDGNNVTLGAPVIEGASVGAKISRHLKGDKVIVFKKKRRKGYSVKNGHRQYLTEILIGDISLSGGSKPKSSEKAKAPEKKTEAQPAAKAPKAASTETEKEEKKTAKAPEPKNESQDLSKHTVAELKELAKDKGIDGYSSMRKAELIEALSNA